MLVTKEIEIDMGHRVPNHKSKCANFHGHRYKIEVGVDDKVISKRGRSDEGMVIDFGDLKALMMEHIDAKFDHSMVLYNKDPLLPIFQNPSALELFLEHASDINLWFSHFIPTAENLAKYWYEQLKEPLKKKGIKIKHVKVWETPTSTATYQKKSFF